MQRASKSMGLVHAKASIFMQSVNVIRNINYLAVCIKTEVQRAAAGGGCAAFGASGLTVRERQRQFRRHMAECGLRLLFGSARRVMPHAPEPSYTHDGGRQEQPPESACGTSFRK